MTVELDWDHGSRHENGISLHKDGLSFDNVPVTTTAAELNKLDGAGAIVASGTQHAHVADPTGGVTTDAEARASIVAILVALEAFGINASA